MKHFITAIALLFVAQFAVAQSQDETFKKDALQLVELSGGIDNMTYAVEKAIASRMPSDKSAEFMNELKQNVFPKLKSIIAEEYTKFYSHEEIKALIKFYESPLGQILVKRQKEMLPSLMKSSEKWNQRDLMPLLMKYMK